MSRPTKAIIDLQALRHNFDLAQSLAPKSDTMPMVKANAYGHGAIEVATALASMASAFGVASIDEALELRQGGISQPILLLEGIFDRDEVDLAAHHNLWLMVENNRQLEAVINANLAQQVKVWLGMDTGMHRLGFQPEEIQSAYNALTNSRNVSEEIVLTSHFACADDLDNPATSQQIQQFDLYTPTGKSYLSAVWQIQRRFLAGQKHNAIGNAPATCSMATALSQNHKTMPISYAR